MVHKINSDFHHVLIVCNDSVISSNTSNEDVPLLSPFNQNDAREFLRDINSNLYDNDVINRYYQINNYIEPQIYKLREFYTFNENFDNFSANPTPKIPANTYGILLIDAEIVHNYQEPENIITRFWDKAIKSSNWINKKFKDVVDFAAIRGFNSGIIICTNDTIRTDLLGKHKTVLDRLLVNSTDIFTNDEYNLLRNIFFELSLSFSTTNSQFISRTI